MSDYLCLLVGTSVGIGPQLSEILRQFTNWPVVKVSRAYLTRADGPNQPPIWNYAIVVRSADHGAIYSELKALERKLGRICRPSKKDPREVDIDLVFEFTIQGNMYWQITRSYNHEWHERFYCRYPIHDLSKVIVDEEGHLHVRELQMGLDRGIYAIWPSHLFSMAHWDYGIHSSVCNELLKYIDEAYSAQCSVPIGAFAILNGKAVSKTISEGKTVRHAEIMAISEAIAQYGEGCRTSLWLYTNVQPCMSCFATMVEADIAGCVWMIDYSDRIAHLFNGCYDPLEDSAHSMKPPVIVRSILTERAQKQFNRLINLPNLNSEPCVSETRLTDVKTFYDTIYYEYDDPVLHPISQCATLIHERLLEHLRLESNGLFLDLGCGLQKPPSDCIGIDASREAVRLRKSLYPRSISIQSDIIQLPIRSHVAHIFAGLVFDNIEHPELAFAEIARVAEPHAKLTITIFESSTLPPDKYGMGCLNYFSLSGKSYLVPHYNRCINELVSLALPFGWRMARTPVMHILPDTNYCLIEITLQIC